MNCRGSCKQGRAECEDRARCEQSDGVPAGELLLALEWPLLLVAVSALVFLWVTA